jgi:hypothetical protein
MICLALTKKIVDDEQDDTVVPRPHISPGRALRHIFNNPSATEGYLSWGYLSKKLELFTPY